MEEIFASFRCETVTVFIIFSLFFILLLFNMKTYNLTPIQNAITVTSILTVYYLRLTQNYVGMREKLPCYQLIYIDHGEMEYTVGDVTFSLRAGQLAITPPDIVRKGHSLADTRGFIGIVSFMADGDALGDIAVPPTDGCAVPIFEPSPNEVALIRDIINSGVALLEPIYGDEMYKGMRLREDAPSFAIDIVASKLLLLLTMLRADNAAAKSLSKPEHSTSDIRLIGMIKEYLARRVCSKVTLDDICREFGISNSRLKRVFSENESCGAIDYFIGLKVSLAKSLIAEGTMNFTQISQRLGFSSLHYFSRVFHSRTGVTLSEFKKSCADV